MKKIINVCFVFMILMVCMSVMPVTKKPQREKHHPGDYSLDRLRIEVNCLENEYARKTQEAYVSSRNLSDAVNSK